MLADASEEVQRVELEALCVKNAYLIWWMHDVFKASNQRHECGSR